MRFLNVVALGLVLSLSSNALAAQIIAKSKNWILTDYSTPQDPNGLCIASTDKALRKNHARLEVHGKKGARRVVEVVIRQVGDDFNNAGLIMATEDGSRKFAASNLMKQNNHQFFWIVPQNTTYLLQLMSTQDELTVKSIGGSRELDFDFQMKGFATILQEMNRLCLSGGNINQEFENAFLSQNMAVIDPSRIDAAAANALRNTYLSAHQLYIQKKDNSAAIAKLNQEFAVQLAEMKALTAEINRLEVTEIPTLVQKIKTTVETQANSEAELIKTRAAIPGLADAERKAEAHLDAMEAIVAPIRPEYEERAGALSAAESELSSATGRLSDVQSELYSLRSKLSSLRSESQRLTSEISSTRSNLSYARSRLTDAESELRRFDRQREIQERLRRESMYDYYVRQVREKRQEVAGLERQESTAQMEVRSKEQALSSCKATAGADCSAQQTALSTAQSALSNIKSQLRSAENSLESAERDVRRIEERVKNEVDNIYDRLVDAERDAQKKVDNLEMELSRLEQRYNNIVNYEIPSTSSQISRLESEENSLERQIPYIRSRVANLDNELEQFKARTGWTKKKQNLDNAQDDYDRKSSAHSNALAREKQLVKTIEFCKTEKPRLEGLLTAARELLVVKKARQVEVAKSLEPYNAEKAKLDAVDARISAQFTQLSQDFDSKIPRAGVR